ncbi:DNA double-strand break repair Rad50 ATPase [alpha proteobacterium U9-1i]|nr:DNA double-strand break repair Rad50 ATPase [alpha proteobacterium U9-1i]
MRGKAGHMNEDAWDALDPEVRAQAAAAAEARGVSLDDYLTELLLEQAFDTMDRPIEPEALAAPPEVRPSAQPAQPASAHEAPYALPRRKQGEDVTIAHRLDALERRIATAVSSLDHAINAVDGSVLSLAGRVDEQDATYNEAAESLSGALNELSVSLTAVRGQLAQAEGGLSHLNATNALAHADLAERVADLDQRLAVTDDIARDADRAGAELARSQDALRQAISQDLREISRATDARLRSDLDELRTAAVAAANHADEAAAHVLSEMRALRETVEGRLAETAAETQARMHAAFADSVELVSALNSRVIEHERNAAVATENMRLRLSDVEDAGQTALEATADTLRAAHAALAVDVARVAHDARGAHEALRAELARESAGFREAQANVQARLKLVDSVIANTISDIGAVREIIDRRAGETAAQARQDLALARDAWSGRLDAVTARMSDSEADAAHAHHTAMAEIHRVEACTLAALEKSAQDRAALESVMRLSFEDTERARVTTEQALKLDIANVSHAARAHADEGDQRIAHELAALRGQRAGLQARIDSVAAKVDGDLSKLPGRMTGLESAAAAHATAMEGLRARVEIVAGQADHVSQAVTSRMEDALSSLTKRIDAANQSNAARIAAQEAASIETTDHVRNLARVVDRLSAQGADASVETAERLQDVEVAIAELRLQQASGAHEMTAALTERMREAELRQVDALETLTADIARFLNDNHARISAVENKLGDPAMNAELQTLRDRVEERLADAERKSIRALEQVMETVALISRRTATPSQDANTPATRSA